MQNQGFPDIFAKNDLRDITSRGDTNKFFVPRNLDRCISPTTMEVRYVSQPDFTLGSLIESLFSRDTLPEKVTIVSAFVSLTTVLRLEEKLLEAVDHGSVKLVVGVDLGGTSKEVLERILGWGCESFVVHHSNPRHTFHPKIFLFEFEDEAHLIVGSNNLTDGGLFSNFEAFTHSTFDLSSDLGDYNSALDELAAFIVPSSPAACVLSAELISTLEERGELPTERQARTNRARSKRSSASNTTASPFADEPLPTAPPLSDSARQTLREISATLPEDENTPESEPYEEQTPETTSGEIHESETDATAEDENSPLDGAILVWRKKLPKSDALRVGEGTHHVGGVRLTQARFEDSPGQRIDQTTYFRKLFKSYSWTEERANPRTEHAFVPMTVVIRGSNYGDQTFEISHKPSGEAAQNNYTTILRWGRSFSSIVQSLNLTGEILSLYRKSGRTPEFIMEISG